MKPLRQNVALAIDGGGIKGLMVAEALKKLEQATGKPIHQLFNLTAGTSTGALIAGGIARGLNASQITDIYAESGPKIFRKTWRTLPIVNLLVNYRFSNEPLKEILKDYLENITIGELHQQRPDFHMVITATDVYASTVRFIKLNKQRYADWYLHDAVLASSGVPTEFPVFEHEYRTQPDDPPDEAWIPQPRQWVDGGVGSYANPCYLAAYEIAFCLLDQGWRLDNTTLISIGTGKDPLEKLWSKWLRDFLGFKRKSSDFWGPEWIYPSIDTFLRAANRQQVRLVRHFFCEAVAQRANDPDAGLDFRRFDINLKDPIPVDDIGKIPDLIEYGKVLGDMILNDQQEIVGPYECGDAPIETGPLSGEEII
jgi:hypothetical protein